MITCQYIQLMILKLKFKVCAEQKDVTGSASSLLTSLSKVTFFVPNLELIIDRLQSEGTCCEPLIVKEASDYVQNQPHLSSLGNMVLKVILHHCPWRVSFNQPSASKQNVMLPCKCIL